MPFLTKYAPTGPAELPVAISSTKPKLSQVLPCLFSTSNTKKNFAPTSDNLFSNSVIENEIIKTKNDTTEHIELAIKDSYKRLLEPAISNETLQDAKAKADLKAIDVFAGNLSQLLLAPPLGENHD